MKKIPLSKGRYSIVDDADYAALSKFKWSVHEMEGVSYAVRRKDGRNVSMHRELLVDAAIGKVVDHKDGDGLNNRRGNIRTATKSQNGINCKSRGGSSKYNGVSYDKRNNKWKAYIRIDGVQTTIGRFYTEQKAAIARDEAALRHHGEFAKINFK